MSREGRPAVWAALVAVLALCRSVESGGAIDLKLVGPVRSGVPFRQSDAEAPFNHTGRLVHVTAGSCGVMDNQRLETFYPDRWGSVVCGLFTDHQRSWTVDYSSERENLLSFARIDYTASKPMRAERAADIVDSVVKPPLILNTEFHNTSSVVSWDAAMIGDSVDQRNVDMREVCVFHSAREQTALMDCRVEPRSPAMLKSSFGEPRLSLRAGGGLPSFAQVKPDKDDTYRGYSYGRDAYPKKPEGPIAHILLGGQIVFVTTYLFGGAYLLCRAFRHGARGASEQAVLLYALAGSLGIVFGVMLGAGLAFGM